MQKSGEFNQLEKLLEKILDKKIKAQTKDIKEIVRDEVESETKSFRGDLALIRLKLEGSIREVRDKVKDLDISSNMIQKEMKIMKEDIINLNLKIEAYNNKLDKKDEDIVDAPQRIIDTVDELNDKIDKRVANHEKHVGLAY